MIPAALPRPDFNIHRDIPKPGGERQSGRHRGAIGSSPAANAFDLVQPTR